MEYNDECITTTLRFPVELREKIMKMARENDRSFSRQVMFMLKKYIEIQEK